MNILTKLFPVGTRSVLWGIHNPLWHGPTVCLAYYQLYGREAFSLPVIAACFLHDIGYLGKTEMDGPVGDLHPFLGARIMHWLFDSRKPARTFTDGPTVMKLFKLDPKYHRAFGAECVWYTHPRGNYYVKAHSMRWDWYDFTLLHSRSLAKSLGKRYSKLAVADKLAISLTPRWFYILVASLSGEIQGYVDMYPVKGLSRWEWLARIQAKMSAWAYENRMVPR